jgi:hypothetical protein
MNTQRKVLRIVRIMAFIVVWSLAAVNLFLYAGRNHMLNLCTTAAVGTYLMLFFSLRKTPN